MFTIYIYLPDTLADWELGHITAELQSQRFFKKDAPHLELKTVGYCREPVRTMGGLTVVPDCAAGDIATGEKSVLLLPGANTWSDPRHGAIVEKAGEFLAAGAAVGAICGATAALAGAGLLDDRPHTSNGPGFLEAAVPGYRGQRFYVDAPSVADGGLFTASCTGALLWARQILSYLGVFEADTLAAWYAYFCTGAPEHFFALMRSVAAAQTPLL